MDPEIENTETPSAGLLTAELRDVVKGELAGVAGAVTAAVEAKMAPRLSAIEERMGSVEKGATAGIEAAEEKRESLYGGDGHGEESLMTEEEVKAFRLGLAAWHASKGWALRGSKSLPEYKSAMAWEERAALHTSGDDDALGLLVPPQVAIEKLIDPLEASLVLTALGVSVERPTGNPYMRPRMASLPTAQWEGENTPAQDTSVTDDQMVLRPHRVTATTTVSKSLLRETSVSVSNMLTGMMIRTLQRKIDLAGMKGDGSQGSPVGIVNTDSIGTQSWSGAVFGGASQTATSLMEEMFGKIEDSNAGDLGTPSWALAPQARRKLGKSLDANGKPLFFKTEGGAGQAQAVKLNGYDYATSTQLTGGSTADVILGIFSGLVMALWEDIRIDLNDRYEGAWRQNKTGLLVQGSVDFGLEHPEMFTVATAFDAT